MRDNDRFLFFFLFSIVVAHFTFNWILGKTFSRRLLAFIAHSAYPFTYLKFKKCFQSVLDCNEVRRDNDSRMNSIWIYMHLFVISQLIMYIVIRTIYLPLWNGTLNFFLSILWVEIRQRPCGRLVSSFLDALSFSSSLLYMLIKYILLQGRVKFRRAV